MSRAPGYAEAGKEGGVASLAERDAVLEEVTRIR